MPCGGKGGGGARVVCGVEGGRVESEVLGALESKADFPCGMMKWKIVLKSYLLKIVPLMIWRKMKLEDKIYQKSLENKKRENDLLFYMWRWPMMMNQTDVIYMLLMSEPSNYDIES